MYLELRCSSCGEAEPVSFETLLDIWKQGYDQVSDENKSKVKVVAEITCHCGHVSKYDTPMFRYIFQLIFDEFLAKTGV